MTNGQPPNASHQASAGGAPPAPPGGAATTSAPPTRLSPGTLVAGQYKLREPLGEGGMGAVFVADQLHPVQRRVALKFIRSGVQSQGILARFEQERQALALMDHANIARVFDAGETADGTPFFVMELIKGTSITSFCDEARLTTRERIELFIPVCEAIQHAHQKGIIHRDLKPSNILIGLYDGRPVAKVIDFGVAKATGGKLVDASVYTEIGSLIGTLEYMSPEQADLNNLDIDTRSDIYALGIVLYELLTGSVPFRREELQPAGLSEMLRVIREVDPPIPSTRLSRSGELSSVAASRKTEPRRLTQSIRGDLDWIVMKCLEKQRGRRYEAASQLALELRRYLNDEPVLAGPPSASYRVRKFVRRYRGGVAMAGVTFLAILGGMIGTALAMRSAQQQRDAKQEALRSETIARGEAGRASRQAMEALSAMTDDLIERQLARKPSLDENSRAFLIKVLTQYERFSASMGYTQESRSLRAEGYSRVAQIRHRLGDVINSRHASEMAIDLWQKLVADFPNEPTYKQWLAGSHNNLANVLLALGQLAEAETQQRLALDIRSRLAQSSPQLGTYRRDVAASQHNLALVLSRAGRVRAAERHYRQSLSLKQQLALEFPQTGEYQHDLAVAHQSLANLLDDIGNPEEALDHYRQAVQLLQTLANEFPADPSYRESLASSQMNLGIALLGQQRLDEAETEYGQALAILKQLAAEYPVVPDYRETLTQCYNNLGVLMKYRGRHEESLVHYRQALAIREQLAASNPRVPAYQQRLAMSHNNIGVALMALNQMEEAEAAYQQSLAIRRRLATDFPKSIEYQVELGQSYRNLAMLAWNRDQFSEALSWLDQAIASLRPVVAQEPRLRQSREYLAASYRDRAESLMLLTRFGEAAEAWELAETVGSDEELAEFRARRLVCLAATDGPAALAALDTLLKTESDDPAVLYNAAGLCSLAAAGTTDGPPREQLAERAIAYLRQSLEKGYFRNARARLLAQRDPALDAVRDRQDFQEVWAQVEAKGE